MTETIVTLSRPDLVFEHLPSYWRKGQELRFTVRVKNPLKLELTECVLRIDGNIMEERLTLPQRFVHDITDSNGMTLRAYLTTRK